MKARYVWRYFTSIYRCDIAKRGAQGFAAMQYCVIFGTVLEELLSELTVLRFHKTNTNLVNFDAVLRFLLSFFVRFLRPPHALSPP